MNQTHTDCPDREFLKQFLLGQLPVAKIENCRLHLSNCDPCVETVASLKVGDTFTGLTENAFASEALPVKANDRELIQKVISGAADWKLDSRQMETQAVGSVSQDRAAEVQRLLREPIVEGDLGAIDHYRVLELIGTGSTGIVYLAIDTKLDRRAVLKVLRPSLGESARTRFIAEAKATAAIDHPNVVMIYEVSSDGPLSFIAMQWIPGRTLEQKLLEEETLSIPATRMLVEQIAGGLDSAHARGLIHRDIKPANVWIPDGDEPAKILDFGLVRVNDENPQLTCTGMIAGTPCFMSPEQSRGGKLDPRSDLFSLGCLMYQCLTGQLPFRSDNALATLRSIQMDQPTAPTELDPAIDSETSDLVICLLEKIPNRRPANASSFIRALKTDSRHWDFEVTKNPIAAKPKLQTKSSWWKSIAALLIGAALAATGFVYGQQIIRIAMNKGLIEIETKVDDVKIEVVGNGGTVTIIDLATDQSIDIKAGEYEIRPIGDKNAILIDKNVLTLSRGEKEIVKITRNQNDFVDDGSSASNRKYKTFPLTNCKSNEAVKVLGSLIGDLGTNASVNSSVNQEVIAFGDDKSLELIEQLIAEIDRPQNSQRNNSQSGTTVDPSDPYRLDTGDVLGVFIDGVLGKFDDVPPFHKPDTANGILPSIGFPVVVEHDGNISLPYIEPISVQGKTITEVRAALNKAYKEVSTVAEKENGNSVSKPAEQPIESGLANFQLPRTPQGNFANTPILRDNARILVNLMRKRPSNRKTTSRIDKKLLNEQVVAAISTIIPPTESEDIPRKEKTSWSVSEIEKKLESPVYNGKSYGQWLKIALIERNASQLNLAVLGLINLADEDRRDEMLSVVMQIARRGIGVTNGGDENERFDYTMSQLLYSLELDQLVDTFIEELEQGTVKSQRHFFEFGIFRERMKIPSDQATKEAADKLVKALDSFSTDSRSSDRAFRFVKSSFGDVWRDINFENNQSVSQLFAKFLQYHGNSNVTYWMSPMIRLAPDTPGLSELVERELKKINSNFVSFTAQRQINKPGRSSHALRQACILAKKIDPNYDRETTHQIDDSYNRGVPVLGFKDKKIQVVRIARVAAFTVEPETKEKFQSKYPDGLELENVEIQFNETSPGKFWVEIFGDPEQVNDARDIVEKLN